MKKINIGLLIYSLFIPMIVGTVSAALASKGMSMYSEMDKPPLSPPAWVFSVVWTILYLMMGLSSYLIVDSKTDFHSKATAITIYAIQLFMNFMWSLIFFNMEMYLFAFVWLMIMWGIVIICALKFFSISGPAGFLLVPYIFWLTFAAYLNLGAYILSVRN